MPYAGRVAVFDVLAQKHSRAVLNACWECPAQHGPSADKVRQRIGAGMDAAVKRLEDLQLIDGDPFIRERSLYLWQVVSAARRLPAGDLFFDFARNPAGCALLEQLVTGPVQRKGLAPPGRSEEWTSNQLKALRMLRLLRSEPNETMVRLEHREQMLWIFLLVDQLLIDVHAATAERYRRERRRQHKFGGWELEGDPRFRYHVPVRAWHPSADEIDAERVDLPPRAFEIRMEEALRRIWPEHEPEWPFLVGRYPATRVQLVIDDADADAKGTLSTDLWRGEFGLAIDRLPSRPPHLPHPHETATRIRAWLLPRLSTREGRA